jgi:hypothetical protein
VRKKNKTLALLLVLLEAFSGSILIYCVPVGLAQSVSPSAIFSISITASINNFSSTCVFGIDPDSTTTYSPKYDSLASYPSSGGVYCYFNYYNSSTYKTLKLSKYIVPSNGSTRWHLEVESIDQEGILTINWSSGTSFGSLIFEDGIINQIVYADMNAVDNFSYRAIGGGVSDFDIVYQSATTTTPSPSPTPSSSTYPTISILSPANGSNFVNISENNTFLGVSFPLTYGANEVLSWAGYSIDGNSNVTVTQNGTIVDLPAQIGNNTLTLYANDTLGNWATPQTVYFFIYPKSAPVTPTPSPTPTQSPSPSSTQQSTPSPNIVSI